MHCMCDSHLVAAGSKNMTVNEVRTNLWHRIRTPRPRCDLTVVTIYIKDKYVGLAKAFIHFSVRRL